MKLFKLKLLFACFWMFGLQQSLKAKCIEFLYYNPDCRLAIATWDSWLYPVSYRVWIFYDENWIVIGSIVTDPSVMSVTIPNRTAYVGGEVRSQGGRRRECDLVLDVKNPTPGHLIRTTDNDICNRLTITPATFPASNCRWDVVAEIPANLSACMGPIRQTVWKYRLRSNPLCIRGVGSIGVVSTATMSGTRLSNRLAVGATYSIDIKIIFQSGREVQCNGFTITIPEVGSCDACRSKDVVAEHPNNFTRIFPNPTSNAISIETDDINISKIEIYDAVGKLWLQHETALSKNAYLEVGKLNQGLYFIKIYDENGKLLETQKLLIQKQ